MPEPRSPSLTRDPGDATGLPNVRRLLHDRAWTARAACLGLDFDSEGATESQPNALASAAWLSRLLVCQTCTVRRECLADALSPPVIPAHFMWVEGEAILFDEAHPRAYGVWGGTTDHDRWQTRHLPLDERLEVLHAGFAERLAERVEAFTVHMAERLSAAAAAGGHPHLNRYDRRAAEVLGIAVPPPYKHVRRGAQSVPAGPTHDGQVEVPEDAAAVA